MAPSRADWQQSSLAPCLTRCNPKPPCTRAEPGGSISGAAAVAVWKPPRARGGRVPKPAADSILVPEVRAVLHGGIPHQQGPAGTGEHPCSPLHTVDHCCISIQLRGDMAQTTCALRRSAFVVPLQLSFPVKTWSARQADVRAVSRLFTFGLPALAFYEAMPHPNVDMRDQFADLFTVLQVRLFFLQTSTATTAPRYLRPRLLTLHRATTPSSVAGWA